MHFIDKKPEEKRLDLHNKLKSNKILRIPGAYNPLTATCRNHSMIYLPIPVLRKSTQLEPDLA